MFTLKWASFEKVETENFDDFLSALKKGNELYSPWYTPISITYNGNNSITLTWKDHKLTEW